MSNKPTALAEWFSRPGTPSQAEFARTVGCSESYLSQIVAGKREPSLTFAKRISEGTAGVVPTDSMIVVKSESATEMRGAAR